MIFPPQGDCELEYSNLLACLSLGARGIQHCRIGMEKLYTDKELSELLGCSRVAILKKAAKQNWPVAERRRVRGGYANLRRLADLPKALQKQTLIAEAARIASHEQARVETELVEQARQAAAEMAHREADQARRKAQARADKIAEGRKRFAALGKDDSKRLRAQARYWVLTGSMRYRRDTGLAKRTAQGVYVRMLAEGQMEIPSEIQQWLPKGHDGVVNIAEGTLQSWSDKFREQGMWGLTDGYGKRKGQSKISKIPELESVILAAMVKNPEISATRMKEFLEAKFPEHEVKERTLSRYMSNWKTQHHAEWTLLTNPDRWKNIYMAAPGSQTEMAKALNHIWELDSTPGDWMLKDGRHTVVGAIDLYSRRLKLYVSKTSTAAAVKQLLRRCFLDWGLPSLIRTDNGADYVSMEVVSLLQDLEITQILCPPFASEAKGTIERAFRTMSHGVLELLDGFIGHNVAERKQIEARKSFADRIMTKGEVVEAEMTSAELQEKLDQWCEYIYERNQHSGLNGITPWEMANTWQEPLRRISDEHALDELLAPVAGTRIVGKKGIKFEGRYYFDAEGALFDLVGEEVMLRYDERDIGRLAVYHDRAFICWAQCPEITGIDRREASIAIKQRQKKVIIEQVSELKALTREFKENIAETVLQHRMAQSENIHSLPKKSEPYTTPALEEAGKAARSIRATHPAPNATSPIEPDHIAPVRPLGSESGFAGVMRWEGINARIERGEQVCEEDRRFWDGFAKGRSFEQLREAAQELGLTASGN